MFAVKGGALSAPVIRESISRATQGINQINPNFPIPTVAVVGAIQGGIDGGLQGAVQGAAQNIISAGLAKAAGSLQGVPNPGAFVGGTGWISQGTLAGGYSEQFRAQQLAGNSNAELIDTYSGTINSTKDKYSEKRTEIKDQPGDTVDYIKDSFLQGLQGGLSSILGQGLTGLFNNLPGVMQQLLTTTGLTGAMGQALAQIDGAIGQALGGVSSAFGKLGGELAQGLGTALGGIPGVGPVFEQLGKGISSFTKNMESGLNGLPDPLKLILGNAAANAGANLVNKATKGTKIPKVDSVAIAKEVTFGDNPAGQLRTISNIARDLDRKTYKTTGNQIFGDVSAQCALCAREFDKKLVKKKNNQFGFNLQQKGVIENTRTVVNGQVYTITNNQIRYVPQ